MSRAKGSDCMLKQFTKAERGWIMYDWANSAFSAIVASIVLPVFFKSMAESSGISSVNATAYWGYATSCGAGRDTCAGRC